MTTQCIISSLRITIRQHPTSWLKYVSGRRNKMEKMIPKEGDRILFVCINNSIDCTENGSIYNRRNDLYEATRKYWPVAKDKRDKITRVVSHAHGIVQMVLKVK